MSVANVIFSILQKNQIINKRKQLPKLYFHLLSRLLVNYLKLGDQCGVGVRTEKDIINKCFSKLRDKR
jgi:hypothetical protein